MYDSTSLIEHKYKLAQKTACLLGKVLARHHGNCLIKSFEIS